MAIAPVNKFLSIAVPVTPGEQKIYEVPNLDYSISISNENTINEENSEFNKLLESLASS